MYSIRHNLICSSSISVYTKLRKKILSKSMKKQASSMKVKIEQDIHWQMTMTTAIY